MAPRKPASVKYNNKLIGRTLKYNMKLKLSPMLPDNGKSTDMFEGAKASSTCSD